MVTYSPLFALLADRQMKKTDLRQVMSSSTLAKLGNSEPISGETIEKLCRFLNCQPGDIMRVVPDPEPATGSRGYRAEYRAILARINQEACGGAR